MEPEPHRDGEDLRTVRLQADHRDAARLLALLTQGHSIEVEIVTAGGARRMIALLPDPGPKRLAELSPQENRVLEQVAAGRTNKEIARVLHLSDKTVKNYLSNAFQKLQVRRRSRAAAVFSRRHRA